MTREDSPTFTLFMGIVIGVVISCLVALFIISPYFTPPSEKNIVNCNDYQKITDKYRVVDEGYYIVYGGSAHQVFETQYNISIIGNYIKKSSSIGYISYYEFRNLTPLNESETDYRGACKVIP